MRITKAENQACVSGAEESGKTESSAENKTKSSRGIAETESKFETAKSSPLFPEPKYQNTRRDISDKIKTSAESKTESSVRNQSTRRSADDAARGNSGSGPSTITDGTSNTILIGEQNSDSSTNPPVQDQQAGTPVTTRGRSNRGADPAENQQPGTDNITDGTSNTILIEEQTSDASENPPAQNQQPSSSPISRDGNCEIKDDTSSAPTPITDGASNTVLIEEKKSEDQTQTQTKNRR